MKDVLEHYKFSCLVEEVLENLQSLQCLFELYVYHYFGVVSK